MNYLLIIVSFFSGLNVFGQSKQTIKLLANTRLLERTVFGTKDSATLDKLFAKTLVYGHSSGKIENREQALHGIMTNKSVYLKAEDPAPHHVSIEKDSGRVKQVYKAKEKKADGTEGTLNLEIETVWIKEKKEWKLARRQARKIQ